MSTRNICFRAEIRKISTFWLEKCLIQNNESIDIVCICLFLELVMLGINKIYTN